MAFRQRWCRQIQAWLRSSHSPFPASYYPRFTESDLHHCHPVYLVLTSSLSPHQRKSPLFHAPELSDHPRSFSSCIRVRTCRCPSRSIKGLVRVSDGDAIHWKTTAARCDAPCVANAPRLIPDVYVLPRDVPQHFARHEAAGDEEREPRPWASRAKARLHAL